MQTYATTMENSMEISLKTRNKTTNNPEFPLLDTYHEETKTDKDTCIPMFTEALFTVSRKWKQPRCPLADEWIRKL